MRLKAQRIVQARRFEYLLVILIIATAVLRGLATSDDLFDRLVVLMGWVWLLTLTVLVLEALLKMFATSPQVDRYFRDAWNDAQAAALFTDTLPFPSAVGTPYHICCEESLMSQSPVTGQTP